MLIIVEPTTTAGDGVTRPRLCRLSDDEFYYVKGRNLTPQGLVNEFICARLGQALGLPVPDFELAQLPTIPDIGSLGDLRVDLGFGVLFASKRVPNLMEIDLTRAQRVSPEERRDLVAFDYWVGNADRTLTERGGNPNLFWDVDRDSLVVLDHNLAFDADASLDVLLASHIFKNDLLEIVADAALRQHYTESFQGVIGVWPELVDNIPEEWLYSDEMMTIEAKLDFEGMHAHLKRLCDPNGWNA
ncbi:hypothetical protein ORIO_04410 [Cereibacter azotoformans]|uniref:HipA family kinase n=1 Tax=Cereibacter azotoformans TaxID=43057 RepID=UPI001EEA4AC0|nr:HipA family kinase [Cereibacter azotoformans]ULB09168.1 hypothetical protein ORIO_04410 [Cereibacter azotoformans]